VSGVDDQLASVRHLMVLQSTQVVGAEEQEDHLQATATLISSIC